jgi:hypothetical protein
MRPKLPLRQYPPDMRLVDKVTICGAKGSIYSLDKDVEDTAKLCGAWPRLEKNYRADIAKLCRDIGEGLATILLTGDTLRLAKDVSLLGGSSGAAQRWRAFTPEQRRFMEKWTVDIFRVVLKQNNAARVTAILRTRLNVRCGGDPNANLIPIQKSTAGDLAEGHITSATAHKARQKLAKLDEDMFGRPDGRRPKKNRRRD